MSNNLIFNAFAFDKDFETSVNLNTKDQPAVIDIYMRCACVSLISAKLKNPDCDVALITNITIPEEYQSLLKERSVMILTAPFNSFCFEKDMRWSLAFYKLCALEYAVGQLEYDSFLMVDLDTYFNGDLTELWEESRQNLLLFDIRHRLSISQCEGMNREYEELTGDRIYLTNWGGEFICGCRDVLKPFLSLCREVYNLMMVKNIKTSYGDEFIISSASLKMRAEIKGGGSYVERYWTGDAFYLVSTNYYYNPVIVWHLPSEKQAGLQKLFRYYETKRRFPELRKTAKMLGLPDYKKARGILETMSWLFIILKNKLLRFLKINRRQTEK